MCSLQITNDIDSLSLIFPTVNDLFIHQYPNVKKYSN